MKSVERRGVFLVGILVAAVLFISFYFDGAISRAFESIRTGLLTNFFMGITFASSIIFIFVFLTAVFVKERRRKWILPLWLTLFLTALVSFLLKILVQRHRPYQLGVVSVVQGLAEAAHSTWDYSFPSFQAALVFCAVPFLSREFPRFKYVWWVFAILVAVSRVYFGVHFLSDVLTGAIIGYLIGWVMIRRTNR